MEYYGIKGILYRGIHPKGEVEEFSLEGDLYDLFEYLTRKLRGFTSIRFIVSSSEEPIAKFRKLVFIRGLGTDFKRVTLDYLYGITYNIEILLSEKISESGKHYFEKYFPGLLQMRKYLAMLEFVGYSSGTGSERRLPIVCIKNGKILGMCAIKPLKYRTKAPREIEFRQFEIYLRRSRKKFPIEYIKGIYTPEELIKHLRTLTETL